MAFWERLDLGQKTGLLAAAAVFIAAQITLTLTLASKAHLEAETRALHAEALLNAVASRTAGLVASDDMLTATSELNKLLSSDVVSGAAISGVDGEFLLVVGSLANTEQLYSAPLRIGPDIAGRLTVQLERVTSNSSLQWSVSALSLVLAMFSYAGAVSISRSQSRRLKAILGRIAHSGQVDDRLDALAQIETAIDDLPLDLISPANAEALTKRHSTQWPSQPSVLTTSASTSIPSMKSPSQITSEHTKRWQKQSRNCSTATFRLSDLRV